MPVLPEQPSRLERVPMAFDEYLALPESARAEYVDGHAVVTPSPVGPHQNAARRIANAIEAGTDLKVVEAVGVWTGERRSRIPDVVATRVPVLGAWADEIPVIVVEVLSPSTRSEDTLRKSVEYLGAGIHQFWTVDLELRAITVLEAAGDAWDVVLTLDSAHREGRVAVLAHGTVRLNLDEVLAP